MISKIKMFFRNITNALKMSCFFYRGDKAKIILLNCVLFIISVFTLCVSSLSLQLDNVLYYDETKVENKIVEIARPELNSSIIKAAKKYEGNTIVRSQKIDYSSFLNIHCIQDAELQQSLIFLSGAKVIDKNYNTFNKYDDDKTNGEFDPNTKMGIIFPSETAKKGPAKLEFETNGVVYQKEVQIIGTQSNNRTYMTQDLADYFQSVLPGMIIETAEYTFSFTNVRDGIEFYNEAVSLDTTLTSIINYSAATIKDIFNTIKQIGVVGNIVSLAVLVTLIIGILNMLIILFMDKQKNIGLMKACGVSNNKSVIIFLLPIIITTLVFLILSSICSFFLLPVVTDLLNSVFLNQFITGAVFSLNIPMAILIPLGVFILIAVPSFIYLKYKSRLQSYDLMQ